MNEFDGIEGFDGWNAKLAELLRAAEEAAQKDDLAPRLVISQCAGHPCARSDSE